MSTHRKTPEPHAQGAVDHAPKAHASKVHSTTVAQSTPTTEEHNTNRVKDPEDWTTGDETMTGAQASYLKTLCEEAGEEFDPNLSKAEASKRIDELQARTGRGRDH